MILECFITVLMPLAGTVLGSGFVFFMSGKMSEKLQQRLNGIAAGVMLAASVWSLILPSIEQSSGMGILSFFPAGIGIWLGVLFLLRIEKISSIWYPNKYTSMIGAVTLHNLPEGMAVGVILAAWIQDTPGITFASVFALSLGIAIQNIPEGAIISMPLAGNGVKKNRSFWIGCLSGIVEPIGAVTAVLISSLISEVLPYFLSFSAGAMIYVVIRELIGENTTNREMICFVAGFTLMMTMDVALG